MARRRFYISFGQSHLHEINGHIFDKDVLCLIQVEHAGMARKSAVAYFGIKWSMLYDEDNVDFRYFPRGVIELPEWE